MDVETILLSIKIILLIIILGVLAGYISKYNSFVIDGKHYGEPVSCLDIITQKHIKDHDRCKKQNICQLTDCKNIYNFDKNVNCLKKCMNK